MKTLLLKFSGPLQSWGTSSHFETRQTDRYPSKSAVIGMIAASLGYRRHEDEKIQELNDLNFGVRIDQAGENLRDYHIARKYKNNGAIDRTYVTDRYYLEDAIFIVAIGHEDEQFVEKIERGLKEPYFQPFMGRRSLPLPVDFFIESRKKDVVESLQQLPWKAAKWYKRTNSNQLTAYVDSDLVTSETIQMRQDRVKSFSQKNRLFGFRGEAQIKIDVENRFSDEHDVFDALGG
ncbi:type I-E CRISPR-associated protein Cas5/CasD [Tetragenococcus halophilus]|uniref:type I-E CRISPR-associated protein Cas5/CasD n=1 Tax=Tetragenococcus halophilus TaxID=51669 RepID=UPI001040C911